MSGYAVSVGDQGQYKAFVMTEREWRQRALGTDQRRDDLDRSDWMAICGLEETDVVGCGRCVEGKIATKWADDGDAENGPDPYVVAFAYCDCEAGIAAKDQDDADYEDFIGMLMNNTGQTREQVLAEIEAANAIDSCETCGGTGLTDHDYCSCDKGDAEKESADEDARVHRVWLCIDRDSLRSTDEHGNDLTDGLDNDHQDRLQYALDRAHDIAAAMFPNATDWWIQECNNYSPRIEFDDGSELPNQYDVMISICDKAEAEAWEKYPATTTEDAIAALFSDGYITEDDANSDAMRERSLIELSAMYEAHRNRPNGKQEMIEDMLNRRAITTDEAMGLMELHEDDVEGRWFESLEHTGATEL
jgi:hypothetical protein